MAAGATTGSRELQATMESSRHCKMECIDRGYDFCLEPDLLSGHCCDEQADCVVYQRRENYLCT